VQCHNNFLLQELTVYSFNFSGYRFQLGSYACPEQYDVYWNGVVVAYVRLRHGTLRVHVPDFPGKVILETTQVEGDGCFTNSERPQQLKRVTEAIDSYYANKPYEDLANYELPFTE
jgi:hypothetical protein